MDGDTGRFGAVLSLRDIAHPIDVAMGLSKERLNCQLAGEGARAYALANGYESREMLSAEAKQRFEADRHEQTVDNFTLDDTQHDTVGVIALADGHIAVGVSTSGLYMKMPGRVGDSPIVGNGYFCDGSVGAAAATGIGEDILRGVLCYEIVRRMGEGMMPDAACRAALESHIEKMRSYGDEAGPIALIALSVNGEYGAASNSESFAYAFGSDSESPGLYTGVEEGGFLYYRRKLL